MSQPSLPGTITKAAFDSNIGSLIVQAFLSGLYTFILYRTVHGAVPRIRNGRHIPLMAALISLYVIYMINFAATCIVARSLLVAYMNVSKLFARIENDTAMVTALIADALLVWRCYMLWMKSKWLLALFVVALIGEAALMTAVFVITTPVINDIIPCFLILSLIITVVATAMIIYRILTVSRETGTTRRYGYIIEIFVQSGIIYSISLLVTVVCFYLPDGNVSAIEAYSYATSVLIPVTGIAPTMIAERVVNATEHDEEKWSQPISTLRFNHTTQRGETPHPQSHV
ncbi:hypothetical protein BDQ17DRAFT_1434351 [Cyathus striatus]|nr:hypothetical protein BDQ17DRAFT_1434351 [Cyathus striatus]